MLELNTRGIYTYCSFKNNSTYFIYSVCVCVRVRVCMRQILTLLNFCSSDAHIGNTADCSSVWASGYCCTSCWDNSSSLGSWGWLLHWYWRLYAERERERERESVYVCECVCVCVCVCVCATCVLAYVVMSHMNITYWHWHSTFIMSSFTCDLKLVQICSKFGLIAKWQ